ncbi:MAG: leucyl aminopeptidase [Thermodesulfovibrionales bacterium]|nr:leucyl aminopeptidase [Thermodesulfovibrionales bacterium]
MQVAVKNVSEQQIKSDVLVLPIYQDQLLENYKTLDKASEGLLTKLINSGDFTPKLGATLLIHLKPNKSKIQRILLIGLGKKEEITNEKLRHAGGKAFSLLKTLNYKNVSISTKEITSVSLSKAKLPPLSYFIEGALLSLYSFNKYKNNEEIKEIDNIVILAKSKDIDLPYIETIVKATNFARDITNTPANEMTPSKLAEIAQCLSSKKLTVKVLEAEDAQKEGLNAYLSVAKGSAEPSKFIILNYNGGKGAPYAIIGKSITFDSGGISLKPAEGMEKMKYDMAGGAATIAVMKAISELQLPSNIIGILPATENLPSGSATKPGDVVTSITGKTIEIVNTDAEGRLALVDAIGYVNKYFKPKAIIDIATLTGACKITFGNEAAALMSNNKELVEKIKEASEETSERVWEMPLYDEYKEYLKSDIATLKNSAGKDAALLTAGYFLKEFVSDTPWAHLDIAAVAWNDKDKPYICKGATGFGVRLLINFLKENL